MTGITVKIGTTTVNMTGIEFMTYANRYFEAAEYLRGHSSEDWFDPIPYHLLCQSLELHLKSYIWLIDRLPRDKYRSKYGHDIAKLWRHSKDRNISKYCADTPLRNDVINLVNPFYKSRKFGYLDLSMSWQGIPLLRKNKQVLPTIRRLCKQLRNSLKQPILRAS
ncbi:MAG: hypothetical protein AB2669_16970 [Candidatus Thiodiazotropha endolucinida]